MLLNKFIDCGANSGIENQIGPHLLPRGYNFRLCYEHSKLAANSANRLASIYT